MCVDVLLNIYICILVCCCCCICMYTPHDPAYAFTRTFVVVVVVWFSVCIFLLRWVHVLCVDVYVTFEFFF